MNLLRSVSCLACAVALGNVCHTAAQTVIDPSRGYGAGRRPWAGVAPRASFNTGPTGTASPTGSAQAGAMYGFPAPFMQPYAAGMPPALPENFGGLSSDLGMGSLGPGPNSGLFSPADLFSLMTAAALQRAEANLAVPPDLEMSLPAEGLELSSEPAAAGPTPRPAGYRLGGDERIELQKRVQRAAWSAFRPEWYRKHPAAVPQGLELPPDFDAWKTPTWQEVGAWSAVVANPLEYDFRFGPYQYPLVYQNGAPTGDIVRFGAGAHQLVEQAEHRAPGVELLPLGVFALVPRGQVAATLLVALALDKTGTLRGSFLNLPTGANGPLSGALDKNTQIVAWQIANDQPTVMQTGLSNLTKDQATLLAHSEDGWTRILHSLRLRQPPNGERVSRRDEAARSSRGER